MLFIFYFPLRKMAMCLMPHYLDDSNVSNVIIESLRTTVARFSADFSANRSVLNKQQIGGAKAPQKQQSGGAEAPPPCVLMN
jgi:hypothetical protein